MDIPPIVIEALANVRKSGKINMFDRNGAIRIIFNASKKNHKWAEAVVWLHDNPSRYMDALQEMGKTVSR